MTHQSTLCYLIGSCPLISEVISSRRTISRLVGWLIYSVSVVGLCMKITLRFWTSPPIPSANFTALGAGCVSGSAGSDAMLWCGWSFNASASMIAMLKYRLNLRMKCVYKNWREVRTKPLHLNECESAVMELNGLFRFPHRKKAIQ